MKTYTTDYIEKRFGNLVFDKQKTIRLTYFDTNANREITNEYFTYVCNISNVKPTIGVLLVSTQFPPSSSGTIISLPWIQFQIRMYDNFEQVKRAIGSFIKFIPYSQSVLPNNLDEPSIELRQKKHEEDRIRYNVFENDMLSNNFEVTCFSETTEDINGVNLEPVVNLYDALEDFNFSILRYSFS